MADLVRTEEKITAGISNIPLTKSAKIFFNSDSDTAFKIINILDSYGISYEMLKTPNDKIHIISLYEIDAKTIKSIYRNWRLLRPKLYSSWRYLFWEIDTQDNDMMERVLDVYQFYNLPVYVHKTMRGYHFLSVKPIPLDIFAQAIKQLRDTNPAYPPITLRIKHNKYIGEDKVFNEGFIVSEKFHSDTKALRDMIVSQNFDKIAQYYMIVWYEIDKGKNVEVNTA